MNERLIHDHLMALARTAEAAAHGVTGEVAEAARRAHDALRAGRTLFFCGNGGSAADSQHLATEYVVRFARTRGALAAVALTVDTSILTAAANDFGFEAVFARQVEALARPGDVLFLHSTSGRSPNLLRAAEAARARGVTTIGMLAGDGGPLADLVDLAVVVPTAVTAHAQELHIALGHAICDLVDAAWADDPADDQHGGGAEAVALLASLRRREKAQTLWYRALAARAEDHGDAELSERFNGLHADEQHHLSRLTARLLELGVQPDDLREVERPLLPEGDWTPAVQEREDGEVAAYEEALAPGVLDDESRAVVEEILASERQHARSLGGKWMPA